MMQLSLITLHQPVEELLEKCSGISVPQPAANTITPPVISNGKPDMRTVDVVGPPYYTNRNVNEAAIRMSAA